MRKIEQITIKGYKSINKLIDLKLCSLNVLIGANGAGKSNFISAFRLLNRIVEQQLQDFVGQSDGADTLLYFGRKNTDAIEIVLLFKEENNKNLYSIVLKPTESNSLYFSEETYGYNFGIEEMTKYTQSGHQESVLSAVNMARGIANHVEKDLKKCRIYHFHDTSSNAPVKQDADLHDNDFLQPDARNLAAFLYEIKKEQTSYYERIVETIRLAAPFFADFVLEPKTKNPDRIRLKWREKGFDQVFDVSSISDGTLRFICLVALLRQPKLPQIIIIDEPELGLHPAAISVLASLLDIAALTSQVIVSTQSVPLIDQLQPENIIVVDREANQSIFRRIQESDVSDWLEDYSLGEIWEKNVIGGRP